MATRLLPLALLFLLCAAAPTAAAVETPAADLPILALEDEELEAEAEATEEEEEAEQECEEVEGGYEECEEAEEEPRTGGRASAEECVLRSARAHASLDPKGKKLKLTIGYTAYEPAKVRIEIRKGAERIASVNRHLGRSGVLRITKKLGAKPAKRLVVNIEIASAKRAGCPSRRLVIFPR